MITAVLGGHVEITFDAISKLTPHVETGKMRVLLLSSKMAEYPKAPPSRDLGYNQDLVSGLVWHVWSCWIARRGKEGLGSRDREGNDTPGSEGQT